MKDWRSEAECKKFPVSLFYPEVRQGDSKYYSKTIALARQVCLGCPVATQCFNHAFKAEEEFGVWGGVNFQRGRNIPASRRLDEIKKKHKLFMKEYRLRRIQYAEVSA